MFDLNDKIAVLRVGIFWEKNNSFAISKRGESGREAARYREGGGGGGCKIQYGECEREEAEEMDRVGLLCQRQSSCSHLAIISSTLTLP